VSSFSLLELSSAESRVEILENLWNKTRKYFVLLEPGSNAGFELINEARDFLLQTYGKEISKNAARGNGIAGGHAFAPVITFNHIIFIVSVSAIIMSSLKRGFSFISVHTTQFVRDTTMPPTRPPAISIFSIVHFYRLTKT